MSDAPSIPHRVAEQLGSYVYLYVDPRDDVPFYVGKGRGKRALSHLDEIAESEKVHKINELRQLGVTPTIEILKYGLTEGEALQIESAAIELLGLEKLTNCVRGHYASVRGRGRLQDIVQELDARDVEIEHRMILINISRLFRYGMTRMELYDATRTAWKVGERREQADYAAAVFRGVVRAVYRIAAWIPAGSTMTIDRDLDDPSARYEFVGDLAEESVATRYVGGSVRQYLPPGAQNPIKYVNCDS